MQDEIQLLVQQWYQRVVPAPAKILATHEGKAQAARRCIGGRCRAGDARRRRHPFAGLQAQKPVVIALAGLQAFHPDPQAMVMLGQCAEFTLHAQARELLIVRDLQAHRDTGIGGRCARPQQHAIRARIT